MSDDSVLANFIALSRTLPRTSADAVIVARDAVAHPDLHVFAELLEVPAIAALAESQTATHQQTHRLLTLFAFGTYADYRAAPPTAYPELSPSEILKLRRLSLVSAFTSHKLSTPELLPSLGLTTLRELEDIAIDARNRGMLPGIRIAHDPPVIRLAGGIPVGRDVQRGEMGAMLDSLRRFSAEVRSVAAQAESCCQDIGRAEMALLAKQMEDEQRRSKAVDARRDGMALDYPEPGGAAQRTEKRRKGRHGQ